MRTKIKKINGVNETFVLMAGITGLVKVYALKNDLWLSIGKQFFIPHEECKQLVADFVSLKYQPIEKQKIIQENFKKLCEVYK